MNSPYEDLTGQILDRRFKIERRLGAGGMGAVWRVQHVESLQHLALKTLDPQYASDPTATERFLREARSAGTLRTRHVTRIVDAQMSYVHGGRPLPFIVMELLEGSTLQEVLDRRGRLAPGEIVWVWRQLGRALGAAHERGIVHRDLKPSNVFVARDEEGEPIVKLCDFGIAKLIGDAQALAASPMLTTRTGSIMGTPMYLAPELLRGASTAVPATDQWALGLMAFRALAGIDYFARVRGLPALVLAIADESRKTPSRLVKGLPPRFDGWFLQACAPDPARRFESVAVLGAALEDALERPEPRAIVPHDVSAAATGEEARAPTAPAHAGYGPETRVPGRARGGMTRRRWAATIGVGAGLTAASLWAGVSMWWMHGHSEADDGDAPDPIAARAARAATPPVAPAAMAPAIPAREDEHANKRENDREADREQDRDPDREPRPARAEAAEPALPSPAAAPATSDDEPAERPQASHPPRRRPPRDPDTGAPAMVRANGRGAPGSACQRSAECASGLCAAETCL